METELTTRKKQNRLDKLLTVDDPVFDGNGQHFIQFCPSFKYGMPLMNSINDEIGFPFDSDKPALIQVGIGHDKLHIGTNAMYALAWCALGNLNHAWQVVSSIEKNLECEDEWDKLPLSIIYEQLGRTRDAANLVREVEDEGHFWEQGDRKLIKYKDEDIYFTSTNALLAIANFGLGRDEEALRYIAGIEHKIGFHEDVKLVKNRYTVTTKPRTHDNAYMAMAYFLAGRKQDCYELIASIEKQIGYFNFRRLNPDFTRSEKGSLFVNNGREDNALLASSNAIMAALYSMTWEKWKQN